MALLPVSFQWNKRIRTASSDCRARWLQCGRRGVILLPPVSDSDDLTRALTELDCAYVRVSCAQFLASLGHRRIGFSAGEVLSRQHARARALRDRKDHARQGKVVANERAARGINVNAIAPGHFVTGNTAALRADAARNRDIVARIPAGRWGQPAELAGAAVFLASAASDYVHGAILPVNGGWLAR